MRAFGKKPLMIPVLAGYGLKLLTFHRNRCTVLET
ncbi:hypothetical protein ABIF90_008153 [Bradyrhizobium japonicum]